MQTTGVDASGIVNINRDKHMPMVGGGKKYSYSKAGMKKAKAAAKATGMPMKMKASYKPGKKK